MGLDMKIIKCTFISTIFTLTLNANAGIELVCKGDNKGSPHRIVHVNCEDRREFINMLGAAWQLLRRNGIGGALEDLCWRSYSQAKDLHPSISFENISDSFLIRCNMGLEHVN
jgi:hypothetical protein